jgi:hypothetical protein
MAKVLKEIKSRFITINEVFLSGSPIEKYKACNPRSTSIE